MNPAIETLLDAAILAPSGDNTQPWRFVVDDEARTIDVEVDESRDPSPMNAGQRMARIACGAAIENMVRTAEHNGWPLTLEPGEGESLGRLTLGEGICERGIIDDVIVRRHTNRNFYDGKPLGDVPFLREPQTAPADDEAGVRTHWITDRDQIRELAHIIGEADALMFGIRAMRKAFLDNIRFDLPANANSEVGLPLGSLGLSAFDQFGLKLLRYLPDMVVRYGGVLRSFRKRAEKLVRTSSGLCIVTASGESKQDDVGVGREFQRCWLAIAASGVSAQPMMSLPVLGSWLANSEVTTTPRIAVSQINEMLRRVSAATDVDEARRVSTLIRFGCSRTQQSRAARRDKAKSVIVTHPHDETAGTSLRMCFSMTPNRPRPLR